MKNNTVIDTVHRCVQLGLVAGLLFVVACGAVKPEVHTPNGTREPAPYKPNPAMEAALAAASRATVAALDDADQRAVGWRTLPEDRDWQSILDPERTPSGSLSRGTTAGGKLVQGVELRPDGPFHSIIDRLRKYEARWGTSELVSLIQRAAKHVHQAEGGAPLRVGDMSKHNGGDIRWHHSHNSGRDVDLAFYVVDSKTEESVPAPRLLHFNGKGVPAGRKDLRFDVARNWRLVEGLLSQKQVTVQWLFISRPLKALLLEHARSIGEDPEILRRAEAVLHQPKGASPHANHFHLRIGCSAEDRVEGCLDDGPQWDWVDWHRDALLARALAVARAFRGAASRPKLQVLKFLVKSGSPFAADVAAVWGFWDKDPTVRDAAIKLVHEQRSWSANVLIQVAKRLRAPESTRRQRARLADVLRRSDDKSLLEAVAVRNP